jgi:hypothetical protein
MNILIWIITVLIAVFAWIKLPDAFWQYLFLLRIPLLQGLLLVFLPLIATRLLRSMLRNLFVLRGRWQISFTIISAIMAGLAVVLVTNIILVNAPDRFGIVKWATIPELGQYLLAIALGLPVTIAVIILSNEQSVPVFQSRPIKITDKDRWIGTATGALISAVLLLLVAWVRRWLSDQMALKQSIIQVLSFLGKGDLAGYVIQSGNPPQADLANQHITALAFFLVELVVYLFVAYVFQPKPRSQRPEAPALLFVLTLMTISTLFLGAMTFFFDYYHVLPFILLILGSIASYTLFKVDHFFVLRPVADRIGTLSAIPVTAFQKALTNRLQHQGEHKPLVVVCAKGGGIQAAGWTAQVLMGLQEVVGDDFAQAIGLISSVSGGSVGTLYYLDRINPQTHIPVPYDQSIFRSATSDSLDAVGWGLAYPDLWRVIGLPFLASQLSDRGNAIETDWQGEMAVPNAPTWISTWRTQVLAGQIPIPAFNATIVDTGDRFVVSPMPFYDFVSSCHRANHLGSGSPDDLKLQDFNSLYGNYDMSVVTAARLSASFPYVSPVSRPCVVQQDGQIQYPPKGNYHMADGGYFDNAGAFTATQFLHCLLSSDQNPGIKRVMIVQINPFPESDTTFLAPTPRNQGWLMGVVGPLLAIFQVRDSTLISRTESEIKLLQQRWAEDPNPVDIQYFDVSFPSCVQMKEIERQLQRQSSTHVKRRKGFTYFFDSNGNYEPPLSWKLTDAEKKAIQMAWSDIAHAPNQAVSKIKAQWEDWKRNPL